jgi:hypothetical protein
MDAHAVLKQVLHEFLARNRVIREVKVVLRQGMPMKSDAVFDGVFFEHLDFFGLWGFQPTSGVRSEWAPGPGDYDSL